MKQHNAILLIWYTTCDMVLLLCLRQWLSGSSSQSLASFPQPLMQCLGLGPLLHAAKCICKLLMDMLHSALPCCDLTPCQGHHGMLITTVSPGYHQQAVYIPPCRNPQHSCTSQALSCIPQQLHNSGRVTAQPRSAHHIWHQSCLWCVSIPNLVKQSARMHVILVISVLQGACLWIWTVVRWPSGCPMPALPPSPSSTASHSCWTWPARCPPWWASPCEWASCCRLALPSSCLCSVSGLCKRDDHHAHICNSACTCTSGCTQNHDLPLGIKLMPRVSSSIILVMMHVVDVATMDCNVDGQTPAWQVESFASYLC